MELYNLKIVENDKILVRAASSATRIAFCNLVKSRFPNAKIYGSTKNISKREILLEIGFDEIFEDKGYVLQTEIKFDKILELVGPRSIKDSIKHLNRFGIVCSAGQLGEQWFLEDFDPIMELNNDIYLTTFYSGIVDSLRLDEMLNFVNKYNIVASPSKIFRLNEIQEAHRYIEIEKGFGKVVYPV